MNLIKQINFEIVFFYKLDYDQEKYMTWLDNYFYSDYKHYIGELYPWGFILKDAYSPWRFNYNYEERMEGKIRGEFIEKAESHYLKISVISIDKRLIYLVPLIVALYAMLVSKTIWTGVFAVLPLLIIIETKRLTLSRGERLLINIENLLELKKRITKDEFDKIE